MKDLKFARILSQRFSYEYTVLVLSMKYKDSVSPLATITKD